MASNKQIINLFNLLELLSGGIYNESITRTFLSSVLTIMTDIKKHAIKKIPIPDIGVKRNDKSIIDHLNLCLQSFEKNKIICSSVRQIIMVYGETIMFNTKDIKCVESSNEHSCEKILLRGSRKGQKCGNKLKEGKTLCSAHTKSSSSNAQNEVETLDDSIILPTLIKQI